MPKRVRKPVRRSRKGALGLAPARSGLLGFAKGGMVPSLAVNISGSGHTTGWTKERAAAALKPAKKRPALSESDKLNMAEAQRVRTRAASRESDALNTAELQRIKARKVANRGLLG